MVRLILPQAARIVATAGARGGSFLLVVSASTKEQAERVRVRPLTHQLSLRRTPGRNCALGVEGAPDVKRPKAGEWK